MVWLVLLAFLVFVAAFVFAFRHGAIRLGQALGRATFDRHRLAEALLETGQVPAAWREDYRRRHGADRSRELSYYLTRLGHLRSYFRRAPVFDTEATRALLLDQLDEVRARWLREDAPDTSTPGAGGPTL